MYTKEEVEALAAGREGKRDLEGFAIEGTPCRRGGIKWCILCPVSSAVCVLRLLSTRLLWTSLRV